MSLETLSERERQIAFLMAKGLTNKAIARKLGIAEQTVKRHVHTVFQKSGIHPRAKLAVKILSELKLLLATPSQGGELRAAHQSGRVQVMRAIREPDSEAAAPSRPPTAA